MQIKKLTFILSLLLLSYKLIAQENGPNVYVSPRINIGYTFGAGINYGFDIVVGAYTIGDFNLGFAYSHYFVNVPKDFHRFKTFSLMVDHEMINARIGAGVVSRKWGLRNVNKAKVPGISVDVSVGFDEYHAPWFGVKSFIYNRNRWMYFDQPSYISAYTYFKTQEIKLYENRVE